MKKILFLMMMWFAATGLMAQQDFLTVSGVVTDSLTGLPLPGYPVHIDIDSASNGFSYHHETHTMSNGFYVDTIPFNQGYIPSGVVNVWLWDCMQTIRSEYFAFGPNHLSITKNFTICAGTPPPPSCHADFYAAPAPPPPLTMHFINTSTGSNGPWYWSFGDGQVSDHFDPIHTYAAPGLYQVALIIGDSLGSCFDMETRMIQVGDSLPAPCHAQFTWYLDTNSYVNTLQFINQSVPENGTWLWSFGDSTTSTEKNPVHTFPNNGEFHVCLTIATTNPPCTHTECHVVHVGPPPPPPCESWFTHMNNWLEVSFEGHMVGNPPATYSWNFGDGTSANGKNVTHQYAAPGLYPVTLTTATQDSNQCTWISTQHIQVGDSSHIHQLYGQVFAGNFPLDHGMAMIFGVNTPQNVPPFFATCPIDSMGVYYFAYVPEGDFVIWAMPFDSAGGYLPTFYGNVIYWEQATVISLGAPVNPYNINLVPATGTQAGQGGILGQVNIQGMKSTQVDQIVMILTNEQGQPIGFRNVDASGAFDFSDLPVGTYFLKPELPNTSSDLVKVLLSAVNPVASVTMTFSGQHIIGISEMPLVASFVSYPNPVKDVLNLTIDAYSALNGVACIYNLTGQVVATIPITLNKGGNQFSLDMRTLNTGIYLLKITSPEGLNIVQKLVK
jgi:PKD repeat protein